MRMIRKTSQIISSNFQIKRRKQPKVVQLKLWLMIGNRFNKKSKRQKKRLKNMKIERLPSKKEQRKLYRLSEPRE
jgi:hypothetical protein